VALALLPGLALGVVNGCLVTRLGVPSFMATLGAWSAALGVAMLLSGGQPPRILDQGLRDFGLGRTGPVPNLALVAAAVVALGAVVQHATRFGRYSMAIGGGEALLRLSGIRVDRYKVAAFALSGCLAGLAGVLASMQIGLGHADIGVGQVLATITAVVIGGTPLSGGRGGVLQSALGVLILSVLADGMIFAGVTPELQKAVQGALTLAASLVGAWPLRTRLGSVA
jgi:ribose transport system permease protein